MNGLSEQPKAAATRERDLTYSFGEYVLAPREYRLTRRGEEIRLRPKTFEVLLYLAQHAGHLVTKEELLSAVWSDTYVTETVLGHSIWEIREALEDHGDRTRFIKTVPKLGYQFVPPVSVVEDGNSGGFATVAGSQSTQSRVVMVLAAAAVVVISGFLWFYRQPESPVPLSSFPVTSLRGWEKAATFSPEGGRVAFSWNGPRQDNWDIYVKALSPGVAVPWTTDSGIDHSPAWSPEGNRIAFLRDSRSVLLMSIPDGHERQLAEVSTPDPYYVALVWSPDENWLVVSDRAGPEEPFRLVLLSAATGEKRPLTGPPGDYFGDCYPAFSPDGRRLAFLRITRHPHHGDLYVLSLSSEFEPEGRPERLPSEDGQKWGVTWSGDGKEIIFSAGLWENPRLYRIAPTGAREAQPLLLFARNPIDPIISPDGSRLVYSELRGGDYDIWRLELRGEENPAATRFAPSTYLDAGARYSPDGSQIVFHSRRQGNLALWTCNSDGSEITRLAEGGRMGSWSPEGTRIVFEKEDDIYVISAEGGFPQQITTDPAVDHQPSWSADGKWIYFSSNRSEDQQVWRTPPETGERVQMTRRGGSHPEESPDGRFLYYFKKGGLWRIPVSGGTETEVIKACLPAYQVVKEGIYFTRVDGDKNQFSVYFLNLPTEDRRHIATVDGMAYYWGLSTSPDGRFLMYSKCEYYEGDLMLVKGFR